MGTSPTATCWAIRSTPSSPTVIDQPAGSRDDPTSRIFPFKLHVANQPYDRIYNYLLQPITAGDNGYWTNFDWDNSFRLAETIMGLKYSGSYGFAETYMYWPTTHMVQPKENALQCDDCHSSNGRLDWEALGYPGDPMEWGGVFQPSMKSQEPDRIQLVRRAGRRRPRGHCFCARYRPARLPTLADPPAVCFPSMNRA